ncbi:hypothetical protein LTR70_001188 [Exophiala xenobiotica]|uniref:Uncharacterized protein n=1 Tax=Lithohypha guttulata TaxID=1690604 RepID=A0ABR0K8G8_9EURO|nr:hypothetical protein LTR24_005773 [Lithohypha guttulata]KAK5328163.1 hypothetical protein LTR70_001188 [Exophiala xenobiotica]
MQQYELRVHIAAPSMVKDDARWLKLAENVAKFKPVRQLRLDDSIVYTTREGSHDEVQEEASNSPCAVSVHFGSSSTPSSQARCNTCPIYDACAASAKAQPLTKKRAVTAIPTADVSHAKRTKMTSFPRTRKGLNPAFKNPIAGYLKTSKEAEQTPRPRTAPESTVLVPFTTSPKARRALSESTASLDAQCRDSPAEPCSNSRVDETSFVNDSPEASQSLEVRMFVLSGTGAEDNSFDKQLYPGNQEQLLPIQRVQNVAQDGTDSTCRLSQTSFRESEIHMGTRRSEHGVSLTSRPSENRLDKEAHQSFTTISTETASDPSRYLNDSSPLAQRSAPMPMPVVDLTTELDEPAPQVTRRDVLGPVSSPLRSCAQSPGASEPIATNETHLATVRALPKRSRCCKTNTVSKPFITAIPEYLLDLADKFDLVNHFHPVHAPASIWNVKRGYWKLLIKIADVGCVAKARRSPLTASQWSDRRFMLRQEGHIAELASTSEGDAALKELMYPVVEPGTYMPWTADEFTEFWDYLAKVIERGRAGYDAHASIESCEARRHDGIFLEARLWCWAEALSHLWLVLYGVSSGLTARMPLQWFGPDEGALVTMSGQPKRAGSIGRWVEQKSGTSGYWGIEGSWEGLGASLRVSR